MDRCAASQGVDGGTHTLLHVALLQSVPDLLFSVLEKWVQVGPANRNLPQFLQSFVLTQNQELVARWRSFLISTFVIVIFQFSKSDK